MDPGVWKFFCIYEHNAKVIARNKKNAENKKNATPHCYGRRSFAQVIDSMIKENQGQKPRRVEIWKKGRVRVDGSILESARETYEKVVAADEKITSSGTVDVDDIEHDALSEVFGVDKKSCTRGVSSYTSLKQVRHADFVRSLHVKDVLASNASVDEKIGKMESKIDSMEGVLKVIIICGYPCI
ncbi:hypothetical protein FRX31_004445 [Thalictrum thalictroides]|uniref:Uncharacterized protein n=1 Tax=Thalictrum thalictroides TaxID=46969 RepID=A0A7J6X8K0_THATH|nr:hypothetical protein FRX31_004445 [Thalictrum thalictroides]